MDSLVNALDAASICGVSEKTLRRFADAGYLRSETKEDSVFFYSDELASTFGVTVASPTTPVREPLLATKVETIVTETADKGADTTKLDDDLIEDTADVPPIEAAQTKMDERASNAEFEALKANQQIEINRLATVIALQEKLIDLKESEIRDLKEQRDWLKARIEKLEEKTDRDQLILASLSQTNRSLITLVENRRSPVRSALEWFGLIPPQTEAKSIERIGGQ